MEKESWFRGLERVLKPAGLKALIVIFITVFGSYVLSTRIGSFEEEFASVTAAAKGCESGTPGARAICASYDEYAARAVNAFPHQAETVYHLFGGTDEIRSLDKKCHGDIGVIPVIAYFFEKNQLLLEAEDKLEKVGAEIITAVTEGRPINFSGNQFTQLTPEGRAWMILQTVLQSESCDLVLSQFVIGEDGAVTRLAGRTTFTIASNILAGGLMNLEQRSAAGIPLNRNDWLTAGIDVASLPLLMLGGSATVKALQLARKGKTVVGTTRIGVLTRAALLPAQFVTKTGTKIAIIGGIGYLVIMHPIVVGRFILATIGEAVAIFGWWVLALATFFFWWALGPLWRTFRFVLRLTRKKSLQ